MLFFTFVNCIHAHVSSYSLSLAVIAQVYTPIRMVMAYVMQKMSGLVVMIR